VTAVDRYREDIVLVHDVDVVVCRPSLCLPLLTTFGFLGYSTVIIIVVFVHVVLSVACI
jgi:hypothetical protein